MATKKESSDSPLAIVKDITSPPSTATTTVSPSAHSVPASEIAVNAKISEIGERPECFTSTVQEILFVLTATMSIGMATFLYGICTVITAEIGRDLHMTSAEITWINASSSLSSGAFLLFFAKIADTFRRKRLLVFGIGAFTVSTLITGFATNGCIWIFLGVCWVFGMFLSLSLFLFLFLGRLKTSLFSSHLISYHSTCPFFLSNSKSSLLISLRSASAVPPAVGILGAAYSVPSKRKNWAFACFSAGNPVGFVLGSILSGVAADLFNWRASFWLLTIIFGVFFVASFWTVPDTQTEKEKFNLDTLKRFDLLGVLLSISGIALFTASLS